MCIHLPCFALCLYGGRVGDCSFFFPLIGDFSSEGLCWQVDTGTLHVTATIAMSAMLYGISGEDGIFLKKPKPKQKWKEKHFRPLDFMAFTVKGSSIILILWYLGVLMTCSTNLQNIKGNYSHLLCPSVDFQNLLSRGECLWSFTCAFCFLQVTWVPHAEP